MGDFPALTFKESVSLFLLHPNTRESQGGFSFQLLKRVLEHDTNRCPLTFLVKAINVWCLTLWCSIICCFVWRLYTLKPLHQPISIFQCLILVGYLICDICRACILPRIYPSMLDLKLSGLWENLYVCICKCICIETDSLQLWAKCLLFKWVNKICVIWTVRN